MNLSTDHSDIPLAIIGMACRLPGAANLEQYWQLIVSGGSAVAEVPPDRLDQRLYYDPERGVRGKTYSKMAALIADRSFDAARCPLPADLRNSVDSTHLLMTGVAAEALRHAGLDPFALPIRNTAVFIGHAQGSSQIGDLTLRAGLDDALALLDQTPGFAELPTADRQAVRSDLEQAIRHRLPIGPISTRGLHCHMVSATIAKAFGLNGPWLALNSACASSLHAMLIGARALQSGRADMAIVGGASECKSDSLVLFSNAQAMSSQSTRPFDADADGLIISEGYVALVLKTLERALADGDPVQAVVRGLGMASDGRGKSLWAPRKEGQLKAMRRAYRSGVEMAGLQYLECHATATQLGDATELETLTEAFRDTFPAGKQIPITSAKANIGHALEAAGIAGVIKTVLCMQHQTIPPAINLENLNPKVDWPNSPFYVPTKPARWEAPANGPRRAGVNAFGIGGLNMHVVLDEFTAAARKLKASEPSKETVADRAVAIIGLGCILPGAHGIGPLWELFAASRDPKGNPPAERWTAAAVATQTARSRAPVGGFITGYEYNWRKHKVPPKQVNEADPLQFMLLDAAEQALADAGYDQKPYDHERCGVVVGTEFGGDFADQLELGLRLPELQDKLHNAFTRRNLAPQLSQSVQAKFAEVLLKKYPSLVDETGSFTSSTLASRISKTLDLAGGAVSIDSGATSAMSALSLCIDALLSGDNDLMICAAGQRRMGLLAYESLGSSGLLAGSAARNVLDAQYDGVVPGEGVGVVILKRLADARRDGDRIHAVIRGLGAGHHTDAAEAVRLAISQASSIAGVDPAQVRVVELETDEQLQAHGTELAAIAAAHALPHRQQQLRIGSSTAQLGHLGGASGMAALLRATLELEQGELTPTVGLQQTTAALSAWSKTLSPATSVKLTGRRLGAVTCWSKGLAYHLILEHGVPVPVADPLPAKPVAQAQEMPVATVPATARICRFGAKNQAELLAAVEQIQANVAGYWQAASPAGWQTHDQVRLAIVADSVAALEKKLQLARTQLAQPTARQVLDQQGIFFRQVPVRRPRIAFAFPGQGSQYEGMLRELVRDVPAAATALATADAAMQHLGHPTFAQLAWSQASQLGTDIWQTQVSLLLADSVMFAALGSIGIQPDLVFGHSYGEFPALHASGAFDLSTAIRLTRARCDGVSAVAGTETGLVATDAAAETVRQMAASIAPSLALANLNAPDQTVVGGLRTDLAKLVTALVASGKQARLLAVPAAFHTPHLAGAARLLEHALSTAQVQNPHCTVVSTVTNRVVRQPAEIRHNLVQQLTTPVHYAELIANLAAEEPTIFVEVGPQQTLTRLNRRCAGDQAEFIACDNPKRPGLEALLCVQALLECLGADRPAVSHARPAPVSTATPLPQPARPEQREKAPMDSDIPHFDATERRRMKMRGAAQQPPATAGNRLAHGDPVGNGTGPYPTNGHLHGQGNGHAKAAPTLAPPKLAPPLPRMPERVAPVVLPRPQAKVTPAPVVPAPVMSAPVAVPQVVVAPQAKTLGAVDLEKFLVQFVVEQTGYPAEVVDLDADLEADLGIDSIKKAQLFGELQEYFDVGATGTGFSLDEFPTLRHVLTFLRRTEPAAAPASAVTAPVQPPVVVAKPVPAPVVEPIAVAAPGRSELEPFLINFVVEQTGYPAEVVDLDADLEADLGIDSIKKAQLFGELQEYFDVGATGTGFSLDEFPTLRHVLNFLQQNSPAPAAAAPVPASAQIVTPASESSTAAVDNRATSPARSELEPFLINFVVEQTGYPAEVVDLDADLEADLGIDSIKKAQLFGELQEYFDVGATGTGFSLDEFPTLRHVLNFLAQQQPAQVAATVAPAPVVADQSNPTAPAPAEPVVQTAVQTAGSAIQSAATELEAFLINFVVEQTGYPAEVVDLDADLEADLGIDSIKKAQLFGELQEYFDVSTGAGNLSLDDFATLRHVLAFLIRTQSQSAPAATPPAEVVPTGTPYEVGFQRGTELRTEIVRQLHTLADQLGAVPASTAEPVWTPDQLDELQGMADAVEVPLANMLALQQQRSVLSSLVSRTKVVDQSHPPVAALPPESVTRRFALELRPAPLSGNSSQVPTWNGPAIVVGENATARTLQQQLLASGVAVHHLSSTADLDATLARLDQLCQTGPVPHLFLTTGRNISAWDLTDASWQATRHSALVLPFFVCQRWLQHALNGQWLDRCTLVSTAAFGGDLGFKQGADLPHGAGLSGLLKAFFIEYNVLQNVRSLRVKSIDAPADMPAPQLVRHLFTELASGNLDTEVAYVGEDRLLATAVEQQPAVASTSSIQPGSTWVITGGARGITAACALELGRRYGLKLHLLGSSAAPHIEPQWKSLDAAGLRALQSATMIAARQAGQPAAAAWERVQKDLEIARALDAFAAAGVIATYHRCDVSDRAAVAATLAQVRLQDGPISGILHGAGIDRSCRFDRKQRAVVLQTIGAKVDGAAHLMSLTQTDPIRHFMGFGSISGRLGSFGQTDYCLASDMLCKLIGAYRRQRPWIQAVGIHWHPWDEVGMASRPETKSVLQEKSDLRLMPLQEGMEHLLRELAAGVPAPEVLITEQRHWDRFAAGAGQLVVGAAPAVPDPAPLVPAATPIPAEEPVEMRTERCELQTLVAPWPTDLATFPELNSPVWILGDNATATVLEQRLTGQGITVERIPQCGTAQEVLATVERLWAKAPARQLFLLAGRDPVVGSLLDNSVMEQRSWQSIMLPFLVTQRWYKLLLSRPELGTGTVVAALALGGHFGFSGAVAAPEGGAIGGFLKSLAIEDSRREVSRARVKVIDAPAQESPASLVQTLFNELAANEPEVEVCWTGSERRVVRPIPVPLHNIDLRSIPRGGTWVVTGGARGITSIAARELARRYGWKLHLFGKSPAPLTDAPWRNFTDEELNAYKNTLTRAAVAQGRSPAEAWDRVMKDVEIYNNLQQISSSGAHATYHQCDITDRAAVAAALARVRELDGPIQGVMHGAGLIDPARFEHKRPDFFAALVKTKFNGALNLLALTQQDPLAMFIGFGSISGRFGGNGLSDYAAGNDVLAKVVDWVRTVQPQCRAACIHWESWEGSGMATLPRFAWGPKSVMNMKYMLPEEGVRRLEHELQTGLQTREILYTFGDFYPMFYPHEQRILGAYRPAAAIDSQQSDTEPATLVRPAKSTAQEWLGTVALDPTSDPFLLEHRLREKPLLPVVVGLEALATAAAALSGQSRITQFRDIQMLDGLHFHTERPVVAQVTAKWQADRSLATLLTCDFRNRNGGLIQKDRPYLQATIELGDSPQATNSIDPVPATWDAFSYPDASPVYHGPTLRGLTGTHFDRQGGWGRIVALPLDKLVGSARAQRWTIPSCVLDAALYACGVHLWQHGDRAVSLPKAMAQLQLGRLPESGEPCVVHFICHEITATTATYDFTVVGANRDLIAQARGYRKVILGREGAR